jgi:hypothetical protein
MQATERWRTAALIAAALLAGSIIGPPLVQAATAGLVTIQGAGSSHRAKVNSSGQLSVNPNLAQTGAGQVKAAPADPGKAVVIFSFPKCTANGVYRVPAGHALIITGVNFYNAAHTAGMEHELDLYAGPASSPCVNLLAAGLAPGTEDRISQSQVFNPGIPVPAGDALGVNATNELGSVEFYGYLVPKADVPANAVNLSTHTQGTIRRKAAT